MSPQRRAPFSDAVPARPAIPRRAALVGLAAALALGGCADPLAARRARLHLLVGRTLDTLIATEGVPDRTYHHAGVTYLSYLRQLVALEPPLAMGGPAFVWGPYAAPPPVAVLRSCETIFAIEGGIVRGFSLRGNDC